MTINLDEKRPRLAAAQPVRGEGQVRGDGRAQPVTSGGSEGTNGAASRIPPAAYLGLALFIGAIDTVNALSVVHDAHGRVAAWAPFVWEYTSGALSLALLPAVAWLVRIAPPGRGGWGRFALVHGPGTLAYSLVHVGGFVVLRKLVYAALGHAYHFGLLGSLVYEYRKDVLGYAIAVTIFALSARPSAPPLPLPPPPAIFDIRDGAVLIRARTGDIVAAASAGNYVEFRLADGRRPLMRTTLAKVEVALAAEGFVRTHRSWLVNPAHVRALKAEGSGDFRVELEGGVQAPLSRRFPAALERLRQPV